MIRSFALLAAVLLLVLPAFWLSEATIPVPQFRARDATDFEYFAAALGVVYGGVALGVGIYWATTRALGSALRPLGILQAGIYGAGALSLLVVFGYGVYGLVALGSFERGVGTLWGLIVIFAVLLGAFVAAGLALLWFALGRPSGGRSTRGPSGGAGGPAPLPTG